MRRHKHQGWSLGLAASIAAAAVSGVSYAGKSEERSTKKMIGMYVHQHWPYHHPYAARTWTLEDWRGYADGLKKIGYNTIMIWPMLETMPDPLTPSDRASLAKIGKVIDMLHDEFGMRVYLTLCPNVGVNSKEAAKAPFEKRHFFYCDTRVNPADSAALGRLIQGREQLMRPLAKADGVSIIDSDPGGYPGSTNAEFVHLLGEHRKMLDRLRPGIELLYWMHAGWESYGRYYQTGKLVLGTAEEHEDALARLRELNPEPWGVANGLPYAEKLGLAPRVIIFNYGRIEGEPSFPMTNFGGTAAYEGGKGAGPRGVMGNSQTHCVQLPNTFAFVRGALGKPVTEADYVQFADELIPGEGRLILQAWQTLAGHHAGEMRAAAERLETLAAANPTPGRLKGLLFGSPRRFLTDLGMQLRLKAALEEFVSASESKGAVKEPLRNLIAAAEVWQRQHGYENMWWEPRLHQALRKLDAPAVNAVLQTRYDAPVEAGNTPFEQVKLNLRRIETYTPELIQAMKTALQNL